MASESNVILITNDNSIADVLRPKLVLLREIDNITVASYSKGLDSIKGCFPDTILIHCAEQKDECIDLIKKIKSDSEISNISILIVVDKYDRDFLLSAYDEGISDYFTMASDDVEILMRTIWCLKSNALINTVHRQHNLLESLKVIDVGTNFYSAKYADIVLAKEILFLQNKGIESVLLSISPSNEGKTKLTKSTLAKAIKSSTRNSDMVTHAEGNKFYVLLSKTALKGAYCVWDKIKNAVEDESLVVAAVADICNTSFEELKKMLLAALIKAEPAKIELVANEKNFQSSSDNWLENINSSQKNFKLFKQAFLKKLDKVITPVFFQIQKLYEEKLFNIKIDQYSNSTLSVFSLVKDGLQSDLRITHPGFSRINIDINHKGLDSPENRRVSLDLAELDENKLAQILEEFIAEFKASISN